MHSFVFTYKQILRGLQYCNKLKNCKFFYLYPCDSCFLTILLKQKSNCPPLHFAMGPNYLQGGLAYKTKNRAHVTKYCLK